MLYIKFHQTKTLKDQFKYKTCKSLFEKLRKKAKINCYSKMLHKYKTDSKRICKLIKGIAGKQKTKSDLLLQDIRVDNTIIQNPQMLMDSTNFLLLLDQNC